jgi:hypothetical protein
MKTSWKVHLKKGWRNHLNIPGTSISLKRPIYTFSIDGKKKAPD